MNIEEYKFIKVKVEDGLGIVTLDNPPVNVLNLEVLREIEDIMSEMEEDEEAKAVVITGAGTYAFCAGADIKMIQKLDPSKAEGIVRFGHRVFNKVENLSKPVIAAINGLSLGGGNELCMACDIRISSDRARFSQPEVGLGLIPAWGGTQRMARLIGKAKAKELIFTGEMITAQEALRIGLVNKVVPDGEELRASMDIARRITTRSAPLAVMAAKKAINEGLQKQSLEEALEVEVNFIKDIAESEDLREGLEAFFSKRSPRFKGR
ncbi:MAG: hypothetical protein GTN80_07535 [Nitrososphaeria archaeon]|nr:hypothetical protein [Nitrososphaeria archaeon]NIN52917.1 hypothetical protein [Nitrososphaeria archaeon]NIQ33476.1 hypothetical protein [Nitrososphaeria archaeon]